MCSNTARAGLYGCGLAIRRCRLTVGSMTKSSLEGQSAGQYSYHYANQQQNPHGFLEIVILFHYAVIGG